MTNTKNTPEELEYVPIDETPLLVELVWSAVLDNYNDLPPSTPLPILQQEES